MFFWSFKVGISCLISAKTVCLTCILKSRVFDFLFARSICGAHEYGAIYAPPPSPSHTHGGRRLAIYLALFLVTIKMTLKVSRPLSCSVLFCYKLIPLDPPMMTKSDVTSPKSLLSTNGACTWLSTQPLLLH